MILRITLAFLLLFPGSAHAKSAPGGDYLVTLMLAGILSVGGGYLVARAKSTIAWFWLMWAVIGHSALSFLFIFGLYGAWTAREALIFNLKCGLIVIPLAMWITKAVVSEFYNPGGRD